MNPSIIAHYDWNMCVNKRWGSIGADHVWSLGDLQDAALAVELLAPTEAAQDRRRQFRVTEGDRT